MKFQRSAVIIDIPGAAADALDRAADAALLVLEAADIAPEAAQLAVDARKRWNSHGSVKDMPSMADLEAAAAFDLAKLAAFEACQAGYPWPVDVESFTIRFRTAGNTH